jgi:RNA polymerase sigma factor (TIGR02999 family)
MTDDSFETSIAQYLAALRAGDREAENDVWALAYDELRRVAHRLLRREAQPISLQTTALVHKAYVRLVTRGTIAVADKQHFFALVARMMRRILVDDARRRCADKRGGKEGIESLTSLGDIPMDDGCRLVDLDVALSDLARVDPRKAAIVELHFFAGYPFTDIAELLDCSPKTVQRHWQLAKAWLFTALSDSNRPPAVG